MLILFYDGVCGFCNKTVQYVLIHDSKREMRFAPLQGSLAQNTLGALASDLQTVVLVEETNNKSHIYTHTDALIRGAKYLGGVHHLLRLMWIIPRPIRNFFYSLFAKYRYKIFGKYETCPVPSKAERERFIMDT